MTEFAILMMFWTVQGDLHMQTRKGLPTAAHCERALVADTAEFRRQFPHAQGVCIALPPRPAGLPEPGPKPGKRGDV